MKVELVDCTGSSTEDPARYAAAMLIFAKSTRLEMDPSIINEIREEWSWDQINAELGYIANTIPSSWEFVHYTFMIRGVTRAFTHQLVRTRTASFAQQTMRILDVNGWDYYEGPTISDDNQRRGAYQSVMKCISDGYNYLIDQGAAIEDARGVLPTNIKTNIMMSANLRTICEMVSKRSSPRVQGEYREFIEGMREQVLAAHPWTSVFFNRTPEFCANELREMVSDNVNDKDKMMAMFKLIDKMMGN